MWMTWPEFCAIDAAQSVSPSASAWGSGDDGDWERGVAWPVPRFTDQGNGTVTDNLTGLMWEVKAADGGLRDLTKTYTNLGDNSPADASTFVTAVNASNLCGFNDWRLPTPDELQSIVDYSVPYLGPTVDASWFPNTQGSVFWSSLPYAVNPTLAWHVDFRNGVVSYSYRGYYGYYVRLVRAGQ